MPKILITGASGFIGSALTRHLVAQGRDIALLLRKTSDTRRIADILKNVKIIEGDLNNLNEVGEQIITFAPNSVVHLAWNGLKGLDRNNSSQIQNVFSSIELYRLAAKAGVRRFIGLGSQAEYGPCLNRSDENLPTHPTSLYGAAKLSTFWLLDRMAAAEGVSFAWLRLFSSYGPGDNPSWLIPYVIQQLLKGKRPSLTKGEQMWDYIFVDDVATAIKTIIDCDAVGVFNLGSGTAFPLYDIVTRIRDLIDRSLPLGFGELPYSSDQVFHLEANVERLRNATGWKPQISLEEGLRRTVEWYSKWI